MLLMQQTTVQRMQDLSDAPARPDAARRESHTEQCLEELSVNETASYCARVCALCVVSPGGGTQ